MNPSEAAPSIGGFLFVTLASVTAGMTASAVRWATIDRLHHCTGVVKPAWDDSKLPERLEAFEAIVEAHYRYYQFHSNSLVAMLFSYAAWRPSLGNRPLWSDLSVVFLSAIFFAVSRDNLRFLEEMELNEIGEVMELSRATVIRSLAKSRYKISKDLGAG